MFVKIGQKLLKILQKHDLFSYYFLYILLHYFAYNYLNNCLANLVTSNRTGHKCHKLNARVHRRPWISMGYRKRVQSPAHRLRL